MSCQFVEKEGLACRMCWQMRSSLQPCQLAPVVRQPFVPHCRPHAPDEMALSQRRDAPHDRSASGNWKLRLDNGWFGSKPEPKSRAFG